MFTNLIKTICVLFLAFYFIGCSSKQNEDISLEKSDSNKEDFKEIRSISVKEVDSNKEYSQKNDSVSFIKKFYELYETYSFSNSEENGLSDFLSKNANEYLAQDLKLLILDDLKCREDGYVCNLDMDPFYNCQDKIELLNVYEEKDGKFNVYFNNKSNVKVILDCMEEKCLISNIIYPNGLNLKEILKQSN